MKNDVCVLVFCLILCAGTLNGQRTRCCQFEHEECKVFQKNGESICEKSISRSEGTEITFPGGSNSTISLLQNDVSLYLGGCRVVQCEPIEEDPESSPWTPPSGGCQDLCNNQYFINSKFLFLRVPFILRGDNVTKIVFNVSRVGNTKDNLSTLITVNTSEPVAGFRSAEDIYTLSGVGMLKTDLLLIQPRTSVVISAYSPGSSDTIHVDVPDCHGLRQQGLDDNYHCELHSMAKFQSEVEVEYVLGTDEVCAIFSVAPEIGLAHGYNVCLLRQSTNEEVKSHSEPYVHSDDGSPMNSTFTDVPDGTYVVTVTVNATDYYTWHYWGDRGMVGRSGEFTVKFTSPETVPPTAELSTHSQGTTVDYRPTSSPPSPSELYVVYILIGAGVAGIAISVAIHLLMKYYGVEICRWLKHSGNLTMAPVSSTASINGYEPAPLEGKKRFGRLYGFQDWTTNYSGPSGCPTSEVVSMGEIEIDEELVLEMSNAPELSRPGDESQPMIPQHLLNGHTSTGEAAQTPSNSGHNVYEVMT